MILNAIGWEITLGDHRLRHVHRILDSQAAIEAGACQGASAAEVQAGIAQMDEFRRQYANPFLRLPMTFIEILPVGVTGLALIRPGCCATA